MAHLKTVIQLDLETVVKPYLRAEGVPTTENQVINLLVSAALQRAHNYLCREFEADAEELADIKLAILLAVVQWYENRGDTGQLPPSALEILDLYRFSPGF